MGQRIVLFDKLIFFIFYCLLIVDSINGFLLTSGVSISLSQIVKIPLLVLMLSRILMLNRKYFIHILVIFFILVFSVAINYFKLGIINIAKEFVIITKLLIIPVSVYYFVEISKLDFSNYLKIITRIFIISFFIIFANIGLGVLGFGFDQYTGGIGKKGFFYAGNELSILYVVIYSALMYIIFNRFSKWQYFVFAAIGFFVGIFISTKVSMLSIIILTFMIPLLSTKWQITTKKVLALCFSVGGLFLILIFISNFLADSGFFDKWVYFLRYYDYNYVSIILSGRDHFLADAVAMSLNFKSELHVLFGYSFEGFMQLFEQNSMKKAHSIEMDFFDLYFFYGLFGLFAVLSVWFYSIYYYLVNKNANKVILFTVILILIISFLSGHVLYSGLSGPFIGLYLSLLFQKKYL